MGINDQNLGMFILIVAGVLLIMEMKVPLFCYFYLEA
jgi:hypothetical protein